MPHTSRPSASRQVPKFSIWASPTASTSGALLSSLHQVSISLHHRKNVARRKDNEFLHIRLCLRARPASATAAFGLRQPLEAALSSTIDTCPPLKTDPPPPTSGEGQWGSGSATRKRRSLHRRADCVHRLTWSREPMP